MGVVIRGLEQHGKVRADPEFALELLGPALGAADGEELEEDEVPGHERHDDEQQDHQLNDEARVRDHRDDREDLGSAHRNPSSFFRIASGTATGLQLFALTHASFKSAHASTSSPRMTPWSNSS